jgi:hypothetical protein
MREDDSQQLSRRVDTESVVTGMMATALSLEAWATNGGRALRTINLLSFGSGEIANYLVGGVRHDG